MPFQIALSGLNAASTSLSVTSNNVANVDTTGFKGSSAEFAEVYATSPYGVSNLESGSGVRLTNIGQQFTQGNLEFTGNNLDLAIQGEGFFAMKDTDGSLLYTRAGAFGVDREGIVSNAMGHKLQVYPPLDDGRFTTTRESLQDLQLDSNESAPSASEEVTAGVNLNASAQVPVDSGGLPLAFDESDPATYNYTTSLTVYDSLGTSHTASLYFTKTADLQWTSNLYVDGQYVDDVDLEFNGDGELIAPVDGAVTFAGIAVGGGAEPLDLAFDLSQTTQYGSDFGVHVMRQDGYPTGRLTGINVDELGIVQASFTNGQSQALGKVAMAAFTNPNGLQQLGDTAWGETFASGEANFGEAGGSGFGMFQSGALEASNVDLTAELVDMIIYQRNYQANAQMISAADALTQTILNIR